MQISIEKNSHTSTVSVSGEITSDQCPEFRENLLLAAENKPETIYLDLSAVPFIDSSGLGVLVGVRGQMKKYGSQLRILNPQPSVRKLFDLTRLSKVFGIQEE